MRILAAGLGLTGGRSNAQILRLGSSPSSVFARRLHYHSSPLPHRMFVQWVCQSAPGAQGLVWSHWKGQWQFYSSLRWNRFVTVLSTIYLNTMTIWDLHDISVVSSAWTATNWVSQLFGHFLPVDLICAIQEFVLNGARCLLEVRLRIIVSFEPGVPLTHRLKNAPKNA